MKQRHWKYCERCGERLSDADALCPNCGAPVQQSPHRRAGGARRWKKAAGAAVVIAVLAALAAGGWLLARRLGASPVTRFLSCHTALFSERVLEPLRALDELHAPGELSADITVTGRIDGGNLSAYLDDSSLTLKADIHEDGMLLNCAADLLGSTVLNGAVTYADGKLGIYLPELDENYYVTDLAPAVRDATGQEPDLSGPPLPNISLAEIEAAFGPCWDAVTALVNEQNITQEKDVSGVLRVLPFAGTCRVYAFRPTAQSLETLITAMADILEQDGGIRRLAGEALSSAIMQLGVSGVGQEDVDSALGWAAGALRGNAAMIAGQLADAGFTWSVAEENGAVRQIQLSVTDPDTRLEKGLAYELTGDGESRLDEVLYAFRGGEVSQILSHHRQSDGASASGTLRLSAGDTELLCVDYASEDGRISPLGLPYGSFTLTAAGLEPSVSLTVRDGAAAGTDHVLSVSGLAGYTNDLFNGVELTVNAVQGSTAQPPEPPPVDVTDYTDEQMEEIIGNMGRALRYDLLANLWPLLRHAW